MLRQFAENVGQMLMLSGGVFGHLPSQAAGQDRFGVHQLSRRPWYSTVMPLGNSSAASAIVRAWHAPGSLTFSIQSGSGQ